MKRYLALSPRVLVVAVEGAVKDWSAYIDAVKGFNHVAESEAVARNGTKIPYEIAKLLFPRFDEQFKWRN